jgi:hypothetical protein
VPVEEVTERPRTVPRAPDRFTVCGHTCIGLGGWVGRLWQVAVGSNRRSQLRPLTPVPDTVPG